MRAILCTIFTLFVLTVFSQSVSSTQKTLITKRTATWCPNCGTWGWDMAEGIEALNKENAVLIRAHYSGDLYSQAAEDITKNFDAIYQPEFYINESRQAVGSTNWSSKIPEFDAIIDANSAKESNISFSISSTFEEDMVTADVSVEFLKEVEGDYFLALYLLEDGVIANQASLGSETEHNSILRMEISGNSFGTQVAEGSTQLGFLAEVNATATIEGNPIIDRNFRLLSVLWKKVDDFYKIENLHATEVSQFSSVNNKTKQINYLSYQNGSELNLTFELKEKLNNGQVQIHDLDGKKLAVVPFVSQIGQNEIAVLVNKWASKIVVVSILGDNGLLHSEKLLIR